MVQFNRDNFCLPDPTKGKVLQEQIRTIDDVEANIRQEIKATPADMLRGEFANLENCVQLCMDAGGDQFQRLM
jgi:hypothetical protein